MASVSVKNKGAYCCLSVWRSRYSKLCAFHLQVAKQSVLSVLRHGGYVCHTIHSLNAERVQGCLATGRV